MIHLASIEDVLFHISDALRTPVLIAALVAAAITLLELGALLVELLKRRRRNFPALEKAAANSVYYLDVDKNPQYARSWLMQASWSPQMSKTLSFIAERARTPNARSTISKALADFDFLTLRRVERSRMLVRFGPALGLMGTLIPLSPALAGLANGDVDQLADNLRVAFSVTVVGLLIGALAFAMALVRERLYGQDHSDLEYVANVLTQPPGTVPRPPAPAPTAKPAAKAAQAKPATAAATPAATPKPATTPTAKPAGTPSTAQPVRPDTAPTTRQPAAPRPSSTPPPSASPPAQSQQPQTPAAQPQPPKSGEGS